MTVTVTVSPACTACGACLVTCPERALVAAPARPDVIDERCTAYLAGVDVGPRDAIGEVVEEVDA